ncbi:MAG TPA: hypothetical protein PLN69_08340 [bacterium]|nr:hypothetical protein [bacterium]
MGKKVKIGFVPAYRGIFSMEMALKAKAGTLESLEKAGLEIVVPDEGLTRGGMVESFEEARAASELFRREQVAGVIIGAVNFGNEVPAATAAIDAGENLPIFLFGCTEEGELGFKTQRRDALCGLLSIATALRQRLARYMYPAVANCAPDDPALIKEFANFEKVCELNAGVKGAVYGMVGTRPIEFETCAFDEMSLLRKLGIRTAPIPLSSLFEKARALDDGKKIAAELDGLKKVFRTDGMPDAPLDRLARLVVVLNEMIDEYVLDGMALQCWSDMQEFYGVSPCAAMAYINETRGIPVACEVDIHGTLSMQMLQIASGRPPALMDWNNRHFSEKNVVSAWHCGVYPSAVCDGGCRVQVNQIMNKTYGDDNVVGTLDGSYEKGPVTVARVTESPDGTWKLLVAEGESVDVPGEPFGTNAWIEFEDLDLLYRALLKDFPHHAAMVPGHVGKCLVDSAQFLGMEVIAPLSIKGV